VPNQNCGNKIHWILINSSIVAVPKLALRISCLSEVIRNLCGNRRRSRFYTNGDAYLFSTKMNFMDEVLFSYFLKTRFYGSIFFLMKLELNQWSIPSVHMVSDA